ncbi:MAG: thiosulfate oxidation carrier complex protein SoxZ [Deltaproteobacteria bacterium]|nr:thiosulfate oxidation carrier complex protein SoxZ [Deltaproteobacteria bacterium]
MADTGRVRIRLPSMIRPGEVIRVRTLIIHPMETVQRDKQGNIIRRSYEFIHAVMVTYNGKEVMRGETTQAVSQNPIFTFPLKVDRPGKLTVTFLDTTGKSYKETAEIKF